VVSPAGLGQAALVAILLLVVLVSLNHKRLMRVYHVITLFQSDDLPKTFGSMEAIFETATVHRGKSVHTYERDMRDLPRTYEYDGKEKDLAAFLVDTYTTGLVVLADGHIVFEEYHRGNTAATKTISWSVAKSFVSALVGIAVEEGHIAHIDQAVSDYVPLLRGSGYDGVAIRDVLEMSSGIRFVEDYGAFFSDINRMGRAIAFNTLLDDFVASLKNEREPGTYRSYVSMDTQVLGMVLHEATGQTLTSYLERRIWQRIGMESDAYWLVDGNGMELAFGGLNAVLRDYARFGQLYLNGGSWQGEQIVPLAWVRASITPDQPHLQPGANPASSSVLGYGYQWWIPERPEGDFLAIGVYGQFIYVNPKRGVVIAKTSAYEPYNYDGDAMELESVGVFQSIAKGIAPERQ